MPRHLSKQKNICENVQADLSLQRLQRSTIFSFSFSFSKLWVTLTQNRLLLSFFFTQTKKMFALLGNKRKEELSKFACKFRLSPR